MRDLLLNNLDMMPLFFWFVKSLKQIQAGVDGRQRRPQIVRRITDKVGENFHSLAFRYEFNPLLFGLLALGNVSEAAHHPCLRGTRFLNRGEGDFSIEKAAILTPRQDFNMA